MHKTPFGGDGLVVAASAVGRRRIRFGRGLLVAATACTAITVAHSAATAVWFGIPLRAGCQSDATRSRTNTARLCESDGDARCEQGDEQPMEESGFAFHGIT